MAEQKGARISTSSSTQGFRRASSTDPKRLQQILKNLLSNAFKFTEPGQSRARTGGRDPRGGAGITRRCERRRPGSSRSRVVDTGIGIASEKQQIIFEAFRQADGTTNRKYGGTGLGLSISREIARLLGGEIRVISARRGRGARSRSTCRSLTPGREFRPRLPLGGTIGAARCERPSPLDVASRWRRHGTAAHGDTQDDRERVRLSGSRRAHRRRRSGVRSHLARSRSREGFERRARIGGGHRARPDRQDQAACHHAGPPSARHGRMDGARSPEARSADAPHSGRGDLDRRRRTAPARSDGRGRVPSEAGDVQGPSRRCSIDYSALRRLA